MSNLMNDFAFIAIGQAGGNIGSQFEAEGHIVLYINTSQEDLNTLQNVKHTYHITGADGSAKDRNRAKELIISNWDEIDALISQTHQEKYIFVVFSSAGGTGSGASPMLMEYLIQNYPDRFIGAITILPATSESLQAQVNAYECLQEIKKLNDAGPVFIIDNDARKDKMALNAEFVDLFESLLDLTESTDVRGSIDAADIKRALNCNGCAMLTKLQQDQSSTAELLQSFEKGIFAPLEQDGVVEHIMLSMSSVIDTEELKNKVGEPATMFTGYNPKQTVCLLSGLSFPDTRIEGIEKKITESKERRQRVRDQKIVAPDKQIDLGLSTPKKTRAQMTREELFAKYRKKQ